MWALSPLEHSEKDSVLQSRNSAVKTAPIYPEITGSDHCPVGLELEF
ncbi:Exodeoxyribonuclease III [Methanosarcina siciliae C2J]|uniref:Exodeoxyribonuclease III n=1 Tax=Methanosarcina siciliae C2J TaxID=1434118 RepID=A0A0E3LD46_9EURY|nr:Exodeoxyribonuclease III [Methanosarcina siciliae C2J]